MSKTSYRQIVSRLPFAYTYTHPINTTNRGGRYSCCEGDPGSRIFAGSCTVVQSVRHFTTTAYASTRTTVCATKRAVNDDGVCEQAYDRVCNETGGQRRRRKLTSVLVSTTEEFQLSVIDIHRDVVCGTISSV